MLRDALHQLTPRAPEESLPVAVRVGVEEFSQASGIPAHFIVLGEPRTVPEDGAGALLNVVREGLHNAAKHACASVVLVTIAYGPDTIEVVIQDDGAGLPPGFALKAIPGPDEPRRLRPAVAAAPDATTRRVTHHPAGPAGWDRPPGCPARSLYRGLPCPARLRGRRLARTDRPLRSRAGQPRRR